MIRLYGNRKITKQNWFDRNDGEFVFFKKKKIDVEFRIIDKKKCCVYLYYFI